MPPDAAPATTAGELADLDAECFPASERWSSVAWQQELDAYDRVLLARYDDAGLVGAITLQVVADTADLLRVMVRPDARGRRLGGELVREGLAAVRARGAGRVLLEVRTDNDPALVLYRRFGFEPLAVRRDYYAPGHDAWVMELVLAPQP